MSARLLTIITVSRNDAGRLSKTMQSLSAFYGDDRYEHIVVDGGSTDHTSHVIAPMTGWSNFRFDSGADSGIYDAMNRGVDRSTGNFCLFLNCGDCMLATPDELAVCLNSIENNEGVDIVCFGFRHVGHSRIKAVFPRAVKAHKLPTSHQAMIFATGFFGAHRYDTRYKIAADYDLYLHAQRSRILIAPMQVPLTTVEVHGVASGNPLVSYREYWDSASRNLSGSEKIISLSRIAFKAFVVVPMKLILPARWVATLAGV